MKRRKIGLFTFIAAVWLFSVCAIFAQDTNFAFRLPCELQTAGPASLVDLNWQQGTTPHIAVSPLRLGRPIAVDPLTSVRMLIGPTKTNQYYVPVTNWLATNSLYYVQWPTIGTNTSTNAWYYTVYFSRAGYDYWSGDGRVWIQETTSTGTNGLIWQTITAGAAVDTVARADASNALSTATNALAVAESAAGGAIDAVARTTAQYASNTALSAWATASNALPKSAPLWSFVSDGGDSEGVRFLLSEDGFGLDFSSGEMSGAWSATNFTLGGVARTNWPGDGGVTSLNALTGAVHLAAGANVTLEVGATSITVNASGGGGDASGWSGFAATNNVDAAGFALTNASLMQAATGRFAAVSGNGANVTNLAGGTVSQDLTLSQDLVVNGDLLVQGYASNVVWTYVDYRTNVYGGTVTNFYTENVYATNTVYTYTTNYAVSETTQTVNQIVNVGGFIDARLAAWSALPQLTISNGTATATGAWDFAGAAVSGLPPAGVSNVLHLYSAETNASKVLRPDGSNSVAWADLPAPDLSAYVEKSATNGWEVGSHASFRVNATNQDAYVKQIIFPDGSSQSSAGLGSIAPSNLPAAVVLNNQSNAWSAAQSLPAGSTIGGVGASVFNHIGAITTTALVESVTFTFAQMDHISLAAYGIMAATNATTEGYAVFAAINGNTGNNSYEIRGISSGAGGDVFPVSPFSLQRPAFYCGAVGATNRTGSYATPFHAQADVFFAATNNLFYEWTAKGFGHTLNGPQNALGFGASSNSAYGGGITSLTVGVRGDSTGLIVPMAAGARIAITGVTKQ